ncbi:endonuclease domain-containing 1 protein-like [Pempheris klunzingeri]|uniref:endonuclease domain-containing 1 protein-like n=1 Tax=Pempheris klunzingeri TaxID=3127111 RepID=UPI00397F1C90
MASLRRWYFLSFAAFLPLFIVPTVTEVVDSVSDCDEFLLERTPPQVPGILGPHGDILDQNRYKPICQTFENKKRFVTLYDTKNKIPVFSAYKYRGEQVKGRPRTKWKIEPQLEKRNTNNMRDDIFRNQATNNDYATSDNAYNRGHLFPTCHAFDKSEKISTFTLTNIVPQAVSFNSGSWQKMEQCTKCVLQKYCINNNGVVEGFVVTGATPSVSNTLNDRINIPSILWSAFCCYNANMDKWLASAHWGDNNAEESKSKYLHTKTLAELHQELSTHSLDSYCSHLEHHCTFIYRNNNCFTNSQPPTNHNFCLIIYH